MGYVIRTAGHNDIPNLEKLFDGYYHGEWRGSVQRLRDDLSGNVFLVSVIEGLNGTLEGFLVWAMTYDLNWCMKGGDVIDIYVSPAHRGRGAAFALVAGAAAEIQKLGGTFIKGAAANSSLQRFYERIARCLPGGECYVSGRAFRHLASLSGLPIRVAVKNFPAPAWNSEP